TGAAEERDGDYFGPALNRTARLLSAGHGGQILLSHAAQELVRDHLPEHIDLQDLGEHRLKDLARPEHLSMLLAPDLPSQFPPLRAVELLGQNALQPPAARTYRTPLIGRAQEVIAVRDLLLQAEVKLVTLTGPGGTGKTRLGLQVATELHDAFRDG